MHIVLANQWYPPESGWGGVAMYNYTLAHAFHSLGHKVTVIASRLKQDAPAVFESHGIRVQRVLVRDAYRWRRLPVIGRYVRPLLQLEYARRVNGIIRELCDREPVAVTEFADINAEGFFFALAPRTPFVVRCHTPTFVLRPYSRLEMAYDTAITESCEKAAIQRADVITAPSEAMSNRIASECGLAVGNIEVIPNPLSLETFPRQTMRDAKGPVTVLHVGRLERVKGVEILVDAVRQIVDKVPNIRFIFVGDDRPTSRGESRRAVLERKLAATGCCHQVRFLGAVDEPTLLEIYNQADICVVPTIQYESFSYTCAQPMAAGKPVVASRIGGIPETVEDCVTGILVEPGNVEQLADALIRLAGDPKLREKMGRAGREKAECQFEARRVAERILLVYERAIARHR